MEWNMEKNFSMEWNMEWKTFSMDWKWNGRQLPVWNMEKSSSIPCNAIPCQQHKPNKIAYKVNLPAFFKLNTISCFILSRDVEAEAMEAVKFFWKRKHFDEKDWNRKRTRKRLILSEAGSESKKIPKVRKRKRTRKHKTSKSWKRKH